MRPIDADALKYTQAYAPCGNGKYEAVNIVYETDIDAVPTIEVVPVVRCKECKYKGWAFVKGEPKLVCDNENGLFRDVQMNDFCSFWERSEE